MQRVAFPLYQAAIAGHLAATVPLPTLWHDIGRKFRLTDAPTLEEFLFRKIYGGDSNGQTTALYYSEAAAYFPGPPLVWMILGPALIVAAWLLLRRAAFDAGTILGVGLWRSSFSGLVTVLPGMLIQLAVLAAIARLGPILTRLPRLERISRMPVKAGLAIIMGCLFLAQAWTIVETPARRTLLIATFSVAKACKLESPSWVTIRTDQALAEKGLNTRSAMAWVAGNSVAVTMPFGRRVESSLPAVATKIATLVGCPHKAPAVIVSPAGAQRFGALINPLDVLAAVSLGLGLWGLWGFRRAGPEQYANRLWHATKRKIEALRRLDGRFSYQQQTASLLGLTGLFLLLAWSSRFSPEAATIGCAALLLVAAMLVPRLGIFLVVLCTPIRSLFDLPQERMQIVLAAGLLGIALRHIHLVAKFFRKKKKEPGILLIFAAFLCVFGARTLLEFGQYGGGDWWSVAKETVFYLSMFVAALASYSHANDGRFRTGLITSVAVAIGLTLVVDTIAVYFPYSNDALGLIKYWPGVRFSGLHVNPNATGKYLIFGAVLACCFLWTARNRYQASLSLAFLAVTTLAFSATFSKSAALAVFGALLAFSIYEAVTRKWRNTGFVLATTLLVFGEVATWYVGVAPVARHAAVQNRIEFKKLALNAPAKPMTEATITAQVEREMRIANSYAMRMEMSPPPTAPNEEMYKNIPGSIIYTKRDCGWTCTGQRDLLWGTGLAIVADHWLLGIGPHQWSREYMARLNFPFDTPHDAPLELWGGYGLAGAVLYLLLVYQLLFLATQSFQTPRSSPKYVFLVGTSLYTLAMLLTELVDPEKFLVMSPHTVWLWIFIAAQARILPAAPSAHQRGAALRRFLRRHISFLA